MKYHFASDNTAAVAPEAWAALEAANKGYEPGYGEDSWTEKAVDLIRELFETDCEVFFTFNGTAANSLALASICQSYHSIICHEMAHVETDECGAPEFYSNGTKVLLASGNNGKIDPQDVELIVQRRTDIHFPKPKVVSVTQPTEMGTLYEPAELQTISELAKKYSLHVHMDGARFFNAIAALGFSAKEISWKCGVDVLCLGGTKLGMPVGDAVVFFNKELANEFKYRCKQAGQLASKMRFLSAPWVGMLENGACLKHAHHANQCAADLAEQLQQFSQIKLLTPTEANGVFVSFPDKLHQSLKHLGWSYYNFIAKGGARLMCSWSTTEEDISNLIDDISASL
jgi:threonine aldolase